jgi:chemotaxis protein CheX
VDVKYINPFIESFTDVMPQLGFDNVKMGALNTKGNEVTGSGIIIVLGIVGTVRGNVVYMIDTESAKQIASTMMGGAPVDELDEMANSALSELTNMLTATAATCFSNSGITIDISTPTMLQGVNMSINMTSEQTVGVQLLADDIPIEINISLED